jgi:myo-inositol-1(or 4)-monophosphatase
MLNFIAECARAGGAVLGEHFGRVTQVRTKESLASVVTEADLAAEHRLFELIRARHPQDGFLGEETGWRPGSSARTWIVDPLDGTSNFVAGLPWFGTMVALVAGGTPVLAALYLPVTDTLYTAEAGHGAHCNGTPIHVTRETELGRLLIAYSLDAAADPAKTKRDAELLVRVLNAARNIRATNSLVDFCYTAEGKLGGAINQSCKLWDIAAPWLLVQEAGGRVTDVAGQPSVFALDEAALTRIHTMLGAAPAVHDQLLGLARGLPDPPAAPRQPTRAPVR